MYLAEKYARGKLQISAEDLRDFGVKGVIKARVKDERVFYSSRDLYRLKGILKLMRSDGLSFEKARERADAAITKEVVRRGQRAREVGDS